MDPIANCFTQLKNALKTSKKEVTISYSKMKLAILETLKEQGLISDYKEIKQESLKYPEIQVTLKYKANQQGAFENIRRVSRPGRRVYLTSNRISQAQRGKISIILSTPQGVMSGQDARKKGLGGEIIGEVE